MIQFHFQLKNVEDIHPWGDNPPKLHWFGLTDGWFWIEADGQELFRYTAAINWGYANSYLQSLSPLRYENYQVSRYWEDVLEMLPVILDTVPIDLAPRLEQSFHWQEWADGANQWYRQRNDDDALNVRDVALRWWWKRKWGAFHLSNPPNIWLWTFGETTYIH